MDHPASSVMFSMTVSSMATAAMPASCNHVPGLFARGRSASLPIGDPRTFTKARDSFERFEIHSTPCIDLTAIGRPGSVPNKLTHVVTKQGGGIPSWPKTQWNTQIYQKSELDQICRNISILFDWQPVRHLKSNPITTCATCTGCSTQV
jgi:hypothetical protein